MIRRFLFMLFLLVIVSHNFAQDVSAEDYEEIVTALDYTETRTVWKPKGQPNLTPEEPPISANPLEALGPLVEIIGYILLALLSLGFIYVLVKNLSKKNKASELSERALDEIENIDEVNLEDLLQTALNSKDFRLAFRIRYLMLLQLLSQKNLIKWRPYKTNRSYSQELSQHPWRGAFDESTSVFDYVWYGHRNFQPDDYSNFGEQINTIMQNLKDES